MAFFEGTNAPSDESLEAGLAGKGNQSLAAMVLAGIFESLRAA
jgi:hypothetical protein